MLKDHENWAASGISGETIAAGAEWLGERRNLHGQAHGFFDKARTIMKYARYEYMLATVAFFHAVIGLERALKQHYQQQESFRTLLQRASDESLFANAGITDDRPLSKDFLGMARKLIGKQKRTRLDTLVLLLPELRNLYFHGTPLMGPEYYFLALQVRQMADALDTSKPFFD